MLMGNKVNAGWIASDNPNPEASKLPPTIRQFRKQSIAPGRRPTIVEQLTLMVPVVAENKELENVVDEQ